MKKTTNITLALFLILLIQSQLLFSATPNWFDSTNIRIDKLRKGNFTLKILDKDGNAVTDSVVVKMVKHDFTWGITISAQPNPETFTWEQLSKYRYFNAAVTGNEFKWSGVESQAGIFTYAPFDSALALTNRFNWPMKGHTLLWGGHAGNYHEVPQWVQNLSKQAMSDSCKARIIRDVTRYKGKIHEYDVYNEPSHTTFLTDNIGDSIIWNSFKWARQADSSAKLFLNDYNTIEWAEYGNFLKIVRANLAKGAPIDGIGIQAHFPGKINSLASVKLSLDSLASAGLEMRITEFDMDTKKDNVSQADQAKYFAQFMRMCFSYPSITGFYFWGFQDGNVWREGSGLYNPNKTPKPAADSVYNLIHKEWTTNFSAKNTESNGLPFKGFFGKYYINVKFGNNWKQFYVDCNKSLAGTTIELKENEGQALKPVLKKAFVVDPSTIELQFDQKMINPQAEFKKFTVFARIENTVLSVSLKEGDSTRFVLKVKSKILAGDYLVASYMGSNVQAANGAVLDKFGAEPVNNTLIGIIDGAVNIDGKSIWVKLSKQMNDPSADISNFAILLNGDTVAISSMDYSVEAADLVTFNLDTTIKKGDFITFSYTPGNWTSLEGSNMGRTGNLSIPNNITTSIKTMQNEVSLFPNPVESYFRLNSKTEIKKAIISDLSGKQIDVLIGNGMNYLEYNSTKLKKGSYFIAVQDFSGNAETIRFIKN